MDKFDLIPDVKIIAAGPISKRFLEMGIHDTYQAAQFIHAIPYGYNSNYEDLMILFTESKGSCTSKHAVMAGLAKELNIPLFKNIGIYKMTEEIVTGTKDILIKYRLPYIPMIHCFLVYKQYKFDLTEGNKNGKNHTIEEFIRTKQVAANCSQKEEYIWYKEILTQIILQSKEMVGVKEKTILKARSEGIMHLRNKIN